MKRLTLLSLASFLVVVLALPLAAQAVSVSAELQMLVDVSGSINGTEFDLQRTGYVQAFQNVATAFGSLTPPKPFAAELIYWSGAAEQQVAVGWTLINDAATANAFATAIGGAARPYSGLTAPGSAINFGLPLFTNNGYEGTSLLMDVSGDGAQNDGANTAAARNNALANGINRINGLAILGEAGLLAWYQNNIQGGIGSFTIAAAGFNDFATAINNKIDREVINPTPIPGSLLLLGSGLLGLVGIRLKRKN